MKELIPNNLSQIIKNGESITVEFKEAKKKLPESLFESICSMLNRNGGHIFLGVKNNGDITGVYKDYIKDMKTDFVTQCNNPEKLFPTAHLEIKEYIAEERHILIYI